MSTIISKDSLEHNPLGPPMFSSQYSTSTIISKVACWRYFLASSEVSQCSMSTIISEVFRIVRLNNKNISPIAILNEYDYIRNSQERATGYCRSMLDRNTQRVRLYQKSTSGKPCLAKAPSAKSKAHAKISDVKGQSADCTDSVHLYLT